MELEIIRFIQSFSNNFLDVFFQIITMVGEEMVLALIFTGIYWTYNKELGKYLGFTLFSSLSLNCIVKNFVKAPRPIGEEGIRTLRKHTATGYSFPSGHTQTGTTFFTALCVYLRKRWLCILSVILIPLIALSRLYLGVHYPKDVIAAMILGIILPIILFKIYNSVENKQLLFLCVTVISLIFLFIVPSRDYLKCFSLLFGFTAGSFIEDKFVNFSTNGTLFRKIIRWLIGIVFIGLIYALKLVLPEGVAFLFLRYMLIGLFGMGIYPYIFTKLKI
ncbi:MAG: phosphatase PAP2 family protein [Eubacteriales bacterium]|nr:phosphatase PAP2 family protein [Eubacteriales bacterium]